VVELSRRHVVQEALKVEKIGDVLQLVRDKRGGLW